VHYRSLGKRVGNAVRLAEVIQVLARHGFADLVRRAGLHEGVPARLLRGLRLIEAPTGEPETFGQRLRAVLTALGPTFVKCGQVLSTRPDLLDPEICKELELLQDRVAPLPFEAMRSVIEESLNGSVEEMFAEFNREPVAAASLSQVYRARLKDGRPVAVKARRPGIEAVIEADLELMRSIAEWVSEHVEDLRWYAPQGIVEEFARSIRRELDFSIEAHVIDRFYQNFEDNELVFIPRTYPELSSRQVLTMDWVDGIRLDMVDKYPERDSQPEVVAELGCNIVCEQVFEHRLFHADPHPGNIMLTCENQIAFLDYGMAGHIERTDVAIIADLLHAMFRDDAAACVEAILRLTATDEPENRSALEHEMAEFIAFEGHAIVSGGQVGRGIDRAIEVLRRHHLELAPRFSLLLKALATIESVGHALDPDMDMVPIIQPYVEDILRQRYSPFQVMSDAQHNFADMMRLGRQLPAEIQQLFRMLRRGRMKIQLNHEKLQNLAAVLDTASNRVTFGVITGSIIIGSSLLMTTDIGARDLGLAGYIIAGVLGVSLLISIIRSKKL